jgi:hypothetical protein
MTSGEVCEYLAITPNNLHQLRFRKQLVWVDKKGKCVYFNRTDVEALKAKRKK